MEDLSRNEAFEAAEDLCFRKPFSGPSSRVTLGLLMPAETHYSNAVQSRIGLAVAAAIQTVAVGLAGTGYPFRVVGIRQSPSLPPLGARATATWMSLWVSTPITTSGLLLIADCARVDDAIVV